MTCVPTQHFCNVADIFSVELDNVIDAREPTVIARCADQVGALREIGMP